MASQGPEPVVGNVPADTAGLGTSHALSAFRTMVEHLPIVSYQERVAVSGYPQWSFLYLSPQIRDLIGYDTEEYWGDSNFYWDHIIHPDDKEGIIREAVRTVETGDLYEQEYRMIASDGRTVWVHDISQLVEQDDDGVQVWDGVIVDITARKESELRLREAEARYRTLVEQTPAITYQERVSGPRYPEDVDVFTSPQAATLLGYPAGGWEPSSASFWMTAVHPDDYEAVTRIAGEAVRAREPYRLEYRMIAADGREVWLQDETVFVSEQPDGTELWQGIAVDITERKRVEAQLQETVLRLRRTDSARRRLLAELVRAEEEERTRIAADIHDDAIQGITAVAMRLSLLSGAVENEVAAEELGKTREVVDGTLARLRNLMFELHPPDLEESGLAQPPPEIQMIVYRVTKEALANVQKHAQASQVLVTLASERDGIAVSIVDDGHGFDTGGLARLVPGHIGVRSMRERTETAGGSFHIESAPDAGTTIRVWVPLGRLPDP